MLNLRKRNNSRHVQQQNTTAKIFILFRYNK